MKILSVWGREILDSRGNPTIEVEVYTEDGFGAAAAPSGASTGTHEAVELRDEDPNRYLGKGVKRAVESVNISLAPALLGMDIADQNALDKKMRELDGTTNKGALGANAIVATSMACMRAAATSESKWLHEYLGGTLLPVAMFNVINGGKHAGNGLAVQEFMIVPTTQRFSDQLRAASEIYHILGKKLSEKYGPSARNVGDEGGYAPPIDNTYKALDALVAAIEEAGYKDSCSIALDVAASSFFKDGSYHIDGKDLKEAELLQYYLDLVKAFPMIKSIEDPFFEESFDAFATLHRSIPSIQIVGDDLTVSNVMRLRMAIQKRSINALLLKVNQIGTVSEALETVKLCNDNGIKVVVSHRSGETEDVFIADFAVGINAGQIKSGAPARGERTAKYNQLLRIEENIMVKSAIEMVQNVAKQEPPKL